MSAGQVDRTLANDEKAYELAPVLGEQWQLSWRFTGLVAWFAVLFLLINHTPLALQHTWSHIYSGSAIVANGWLPPVTAQASAGVPLSQGMVATNGSWLFDALAFAFADRFGPDAISAAIALLASMAMWLWCGLIYRATSAVLGDESAHRTGLWQATVSAVVLSVCWIANYASLTPNLLAMVLFACVVWVLARAIPIGRERQRELTIGQIGACAILFIAWVNVDGSFVIGLLSIAAIAIGHVIESAKVATWQSALARRSVQRWFWLLQLCVLATLVNPIHFGLWQQTVTTKFDALLSGISRGQGLYLPTAAGGLMIVLLGYVWLRSAKGGRVKVGRAFNAVEASVIALFVTLAIVSVANVYWCVPVFLLIAARHPSESTTAEAPTTAETKLPNETEERSLPFAGTLCCLLLVWCAFALSTASRGVLGGKPRAAQRMFGADVPLMVSEQLKKQSPQSPDDFGWTDSARPLVFAPADWSDWLLWDCRNGMRVFSDSNLERLPRRAQADYTKIFRGESGWDKLLDRYAVGTIVVDKTRQKKLASEVMRHGHWRLTLETPRSLTMQRVARNRSATAGVNHE